MFSARRQIDALQYMPPESLLLKAMPGVNGWYETFLGRLAGIAVLILLCIIADLHQVKHWKFGGHKMVCRPPNALKVNDMVTFNGVTCRPEMNGRKFAIVCRDEQKEGHWIVRSVERIFAQNLLDVLRPGEGIPGTLVDLVFATESVAEDKLLLVMAAEELDAALDAASQHEVSDNDSHSKTDNG